MKYTGVFVHDEDDSNAENEACERCGESNPVELSRVESSGIGLA